MKDSCDTLREAFREIAKEYSYEIFDDINRTRGFIRDLLAEQELERNKFDIFVKADGPRKMLDALEFDAEEQNAVMIGVARSIQKQSVAEETAFDICRSFGEAIGAKLPAEKAKPKTDKPKSKPALKPPVQENPVHRESRTEQPKSRESTRGYEPPAAPYVSVSAIIPGMIFEDVPGGKRVARYDGVESVITVPESMGGKPVVEIGPRAFSQGRTRTKLSGVIIPATVTMIGEGAFEGCSALISCLIQGGSANEVKMGRRAFADTGLQKVELPERISSIPEECYAGCAALRTAVLPQSIEDIGAHAFEECELMEYINMPETVLSIGKGAFAWSGLKEIHLPKAMNCIQESVFEGCTQLRQVQWPEQLECIEDRAFCGCTFLESGVLPEAVEAIGRESFYGCESLISVSGANELSRIGYRAFAGCTHLKKVGLPESVLKQAGGKLVFEGCSKLGGMKPGIVQRAFAKRENLE